MTTIEKILKDINTKEGQEMLKKWAEEFAQKETIKKDKMQRILSSTDYLKWLEKFTLIHEKFFDDDWLYFPDKISVEDRLHVEDLYLLYLGIEKYSNENYIYPITTEELTYYRIKLDNIGYEIGVLHGLGTVFSCKRVKIDDEENFIDFNNIINNKKGNNVDMIKTGLDSLSNLIITLYEKGIPVNAINSTIDSTLDTINKKDDLKLSLKK